jgi:hypothetical protein
MYREVLLIVGMPRSGTSWLSQIFDSSPDVRFRLSPIFSYEFKNSVSESSTAVDWRRLFDGAYASDSTFMNQTERRRTGQYPTFVLKLEAPSFLVLKDTRFHNLLEPLLRTVEYVKAIAIVRHPCGAIHSWLTAPNEFPENADPMAQWRSGACRKSGFGEFWGFDDWLAVTRLHVRLANQFPDRVKIVRYEDLVADRTVQIKKLFEFVGLGFGNQTEQFLKDSQGKHDVNQYAVFKHPAVADRWRTELDSRIQQEIIEAVRGTDLAGFL